VQLPTTLQALRLNIRARCSGSTRQCDCSIQAVRLAFVQSIQEDAGTYALRCCRGANRRFHRSGAGSSGGGVQAALSGLLAALPWWQPRSLEAPLPLQAPGSEGVCKSDLLAAEKSDKEGVTHTCVQP